MLKWLTRFSLRNGAVIIIAMLMVILGGVFSYMKIPNADYPNVDIPWIHVTIGYPGATPEQSYNDIGKLLEPKLSTIDGLKKLYSVSGTGFQEFDMEVDMARKDKDVDRDIQDVINQVQLPTTAQKPNIANETISNPSIYVFSVTSDSADIQDIQAYVENTLKPQLSAVAGVGDVRINGDTKKNIYVQVNTDKMKQHGVTWQQVQQALVANNFASPIGNMNVDTQSMPVVVGGKVTSLQQIKDFPIVLAQHGLMGRSMSGSPSTTDTTQTLRIGDVADVVYQDDPTNQSLTRTDGKPGVVVQVIPSINANTIQVAHDVKATLQSVSLPANMHWQELDNEADHVKQSVGGMMREAALGALFAVIVTLLFLRDLRATVVALLSIPLSIFAAIIMMSVMGYSLNMMTLSGMAVAVGRVVDDSIVVIENIYRRLRSRNGEHTQGMVEDATLEVGSAITSSTATTLAVFLPMTVVPGIVGHVFAPFAWTVVIALAFSLLVALMVVPLISRMSLLSVKPTVKRETWMQRKYRSALRWSLSHKWMVIVLGVLLLAESAFAATKVGFNFLPAGRETVFMVHANMPVASSMQATNQVAQQIEQLLSHNDGVKTYQSFVKQGSAEVDLFVKDSVKNTDSFANDLRNQLKSVTGAHRITVAGTSGPGDSSVNLILQGADYTTLKDAADKAETALQNIPGLADVTTSAQASMPQVQVDVSAAKAAQYGLDPMTVAGNIRNLLGGDAVTKVEYQGRSTDVNLMIGNGSVTSMDQLGQQVLTTPTGESVRIDQIANLSVVKGPNSIARLNQQQYIQLTGSIVSTNQSAVTAAVDKTMQSLSLPAGISYHQEGASEEMNQGFRDIGIAMLGSFLLVLVVMLITFGEWAAPLAIVFALPFAIVGGFNGLWLTHQPLGMPGMIGFMMLIGIIVTNAIVLMDRVERQRRNGLSVRDALIEAGGVRLRPILMTATATIGALIPLAFTSDIGIISKTLAIVVIGGLITSTLLTLVIVPIMYEWFCAIREKVFGRRSAKDMDNKVRNKVRVVEP